MTLRQARIRAAAASLLIQLFFLWFWSASTNGCFCFQREEIGGGDPLAVAWNVVVRPLDMLLPYWTARYHLVTLGLINFVIWFIPLYAVLRLWMAATGGRRPVPEAG